MTPVLKKVLYMPILGRYKKMRKNEKIGVVVVAEEELGGRGGGRYYFVVAF